MASMQNLDLKLMKTFAAIVECDGFSAAQYRLNVSLSTISSTMSQLESRLGFKVCERGRRGFELTEGGKVVYEEWQKTSRSIDAFIQAVESFKGEMRGHVTIAADDFFVSNVRCPIYKVVRDFARKAPNVTLKIEIVSPPEMEKALLDNEVNIAIGPFQEASPAINLSKVYLEKQLLCCGRGHPAFETTNPEKLANIVRESEYIGRSYADVTSLNVNTELKKSTSASNTEAILVMVLTGRFLGYIPRHACENWIASNELRALPVDRYSYDTPIYTAYRKDHNDPRVKLFLDCASRIVG